VYTLADSVALHLLAAAADRTDPGREPALALRARGVVGAVHDPWVPATSIAISLMR
jgi:hypothetical protein